MEAMTQMMALVGVYARFVDHFGNPLSGTVEFSAGSEDSPNSQRVKMEPATVTRLAP